MKNIKWFNLIKLVIFMVCAYIVLHDAIMLIMGYTFTWFGLATCLLAFGLMSMIWDDFEDQVKDIEKRKRLNKDTRSR